MRAALILTLVLATFTGVGCAAPVEEVEEQESTESSLKGEGPFKQAQKRMEEIRGDLASNQAHLRGVLDGQQHDDYAAAFWKLKRVTDARTAYVSATLALGASLAAKTTELKKAKKFSALDPNTTRDLRDAYANAEALATSNVLGKGANAPAYAVRDFYVFLASNKSARESIGKSLDALEANLGANHALVVAQVAADQPGIDGLALVREALEKVGAVSTVAAALQKDLEGFSNGTETLEKANPIAKTTGGVVALLHLATLGNDLRKGHYQDFVEHALASGAGDVAALAEAVSLLEGTFESARAAAVFGNTAKLAAISGRFAAGVSVVTTAISLIKDIETYEADRLLHIARISADASAFAASVVALGGAALSAAAPYVTALVLVTQGVLAVANYWHKKAATERRNKDTKALLREIKLMGPVADMLADADRSTLSALAGKGERELGLSPQDIQSLAASVTKLKNGSVAFFEANDNPLWIAEASEVKRLLNLDSAATLEMLRATAGTDGTLVRIVFGGFGGCLSSRDGVHADAAHLRDAITSCAEQGPADERAAFTRLAAFAAKH